MVSSELRMRVAQNCDAYVSRHTLGVMNIITYESESCDSCINYERGKCIEELFDVIRETITVN